MEKPFPALCRECRHSAKAPHDWYGLFCHNPAVNARDSLALSGSDRRPGSSCERERSKVFFAACGRSGKLWQAKTEAAPVVMSPA